MTCVLQECLAMLEPGMLENTIENCEMDFCLTGDESLECTALEDLASRCADELHLVVQYQSENLCRKLSFETQQRVYAAWLMQESLMWYKFSIIVLCR